MTTHRTREPLGESGTTDHARRRYRLRYDPSSEDDLTTVVVGALADARGVDPVEVEPLNDVVDPDAMNQLFRPRGDGTPRTGASLSFTHSGCEVVVHGDGRIEIEPAERR